MNMSSKVQTDPKYGSVVQLQKLPYGFIVSNANIKQRLSKENFSPSQTDKVVGSKLSLARKRV